MVGESLLSRDQRHKKENKREQRNQRVWWVTDKPGPKEEETTREIRGWGGSQLSSDQKKLKGPESTERRGRDDNGKKEPNKRAHESRERKGTHEMQ